MNNIRNPEKRKELEERLNEAQELSLDEASVKRQLVRQVGNLQILQEQAAEYGMRPPLDLVNQITDVEEKIQELQLNLKRLKDNG